VLTGLGGADTFRLTNLRDSLLGAPDQITGYSGSLAALAIV
jgi:endoglucanase